MKWTAGLIAKGGDFSRWPPGKRRLREFQECNPKPPNKPVSSSEKPILSRDPVLMADLVNIKIFEDKKLIRSLDVRLPVVLGRQAVPEAELYTVLEDQNTRKINIARLGETTVGRSHLRIEPLPINAVAITNINTNRAVHIVDKANLTPGACYHSELPTVVTFEKQGRRHIIISDEGSQLMSMSSGTIPPGAMNSGSSQISISSFRKLTRDSVERVEILGWLDRLMDVLQSAADSDHFFSRAVQAALEMAELDQVLLLLYDGSSWLTKTSATAPGATTAIQAPSRRILSIIVDEKRTFWQLIPPQSQINQSLAYVDSVIVAPVLSSGGNVIGAIYGVRLAGPLRPDLTVSEGVREPISEIEARLVELLAKGVAAGIARMEQEKQAVAAKVRFEQFFTPQLANQLASIPDWDKGRQANITALFVDIKDFTKLSEHLDPSLTIRWIQDSLNLLSECVLNWGGVLVDYIGDAILAIWGAPGEQPDHAERACRAALDMVACLDTLGPRWEAILGEKMQLSIGINSGMAQVGNTGSRQKFKYGALGPTVNLCSRIQGINKRLGTRILISEATEKKLPPEILTRRVASVLPNNFDTPVVLHEVFPAGQNSWPRCKTDYEKALSLFEKGEFLLSASMLGNFRLEHPDDGPALLLLYRAVRGMVEGREGNHPLWVFRNK
jgi:adenylate cyclase